jgi:hypothetical protein
MNSPIQRKKTRRELPINVSSLCRKYDRGDKRIDINRLEELLEKWYLGEKIHWKTIGPTLIKPGRRIPLPQ